MLLTEDAAAQPGVGGHHQVAQRLGEGPFPVHAQILRPGGQLIQGTAGGRPMGADRIPGLEQFCAVVRAARLSPREPAVQFLLHEPGDLHVVEEHALTPGTEPGAVDACAAQFNGAHPHLTQVAAGEPGPAQVGVGEVRLRQLPTGAQAPRVVHLAPPPSALRRWGHSATTV